MKFINLGLISLIIFSLLLTAISLLLPSTVNISRAIDIQAPFDTIYNNINDLSKWHNWYANYDSFHATLSKKPVGKGASIIMNKTTVTIEENTSNKIKTIWKSGSKILSGEFNLFKQKNTDLVTVQWHFVQHVKWYPWEKFALIISDKTIGPVMEKSLDNLSKNASFTTISK